MGLILFEVNFHLEIISFRNISFHFAYVWFYVELVINSASQFSSFTRNRQQYCWTTQSIQRHCMQSFLNFTIYKFYIFYSFLRKTVHYFILNCLYWFICFFFSSIYIVFLLLLYIFHPSIFLQFWENFIDYFGNILLHTLW